MARLVLNLFTSMFLSALAAVLLYLYYARVWYDPLKWLEITEVVILYIFLVWGITWTVISVVHHMRDK